MDRSHSSSGPHHAGCGEDDAQEANHDQRLGNPSHRKLCLLTHCNADIPFSRSETLALPQTLKAVSTPSRISRRHRCSRFGPISQARATSATDAPLSSRRTAPNLNSFVNFLLHDLGGHFTMIAKDSVVKCTSMNVQAALDEVLTSALTLIAPLRELLPHCYMTLDSLLAGSNRRTAPDRGCGRYVERENRPSRTGCSG